MKNRVFIFSCFILCISIYSQEIVEINDIAFKNCLLANEQINTNGDNEIQVIEADEFSGEINCTSYGLTDVTGIEAFHNLTRLNIGSNHLQSIDLTQNTSLTDIRIDNNNLDVIDLSENTLLTKLDLSHNSLNNINLEQNTLLNYLNLYSNDIQEINIESNLLLDSLSIGNNILDEINLSNLTNLIYLDLSVNNSLDEINLSSLTNLIYLDLSGTNIDEIDLSYTTNLTDLNLNSSNLTNIDLSQNTLLESVDLGNNELTGLDLSNNLSLKSINLTSNTNLSELNFAMNNTLERLSITATSIAMIDLAQLPLLEYFGISYNDLIEELDFSNNSFIYDVTTEFCSNLSYVNIANGNNESIRRVDVRSCPNLECVQIDEDFEPCLCPPVLWRIDDDSVYSDNCFMGTEEVNLEEQIQLYPNPVKDVLHIDSMFAIQEIRIYNMQAKLIKFFAAKKDIYLEDLLTGTYIIQIETEKGIYTEKIFKK